MEEKKESERNRTSADWTSEDKGECEVCEYDLLPDEDTEGTALYYYKLFPGLDEDFYYLLQCAHRQDMDPKVAVDLCRDIVDMRNEQRLNSLEGRTVPHEIEISTGELEYDTTIPEQFKRLEILERDE